MKNSISLQKYFLPVVLFTVCLLANLNLKGQNVNTDIHAVNYNGQIAIRANNSFILNSYFVVNNNMVDLAFYFGPEDPRNGNYNGGVYAQPNGSALIRFSDIPYQSNEALTFTATETLTTGTVKPYVFVGGDNLLDAGGPVDACPTRIECSNWSILLYFDPNDYVVGPTNSVFSIFAPGLIQNGVLHSGAYNSALNFIKLTSPINKNFNCELLAGEVTIMIDGLTCTYLNGQYISPTNCTPWGGYYSGDQECAPYFESCALDLINILNEAKTTLPCHQWIDHNLHTTTDPINRPGKVAIGTSNFAPDANLTVKNGIITDKVKVTATGWADYVFDKDYPLMPLEQVDAYIQQFHHLPDTPSAAQVEADGSFELGATTLNHQVKIEEIFLHLINLEEETKGLESVLFLQETLNKIRIN